MRKGRGEGRGDEEGKGREGGMKKGRGEEEGRREGKEGREGGKGRREGKEMKRMRKITHVRKVHITCLSEGIAPNDSGCTWASSILPLISNLLTRIRIFDSTSPDLCTHQNRYQGQET